MEDPFSSQSSPDSQLNLSTAEFTCPYCHKSPDVTEKMGSMITLRPCEHSFRRTDLTVVIEHLRELDDLIQRHSAAATPFERQGLREEIHTVGAQLDAAAERCETHMTSP